MQQTLEQKLKLIDEHDNRVLMTVCLNLTLYFKEGYQKDKRDAILAMLSDYQAMMQGKLNFTTNPHTGSWKNLTKTPYPTPHRWLPDLPDEPWEFIYHGGQHHRDASDIRFRILGRAKWKEEQGDLNWVTINFPLTFFADWEETFQDVVLRWIDWLQPVHGYAAIATTHNHFDNYQHEMAEYQFAQQYPGLDVSKHTSHGIKLRNTFIKGVNWLTIINQPFLDKVGGVEAVQAIPDIKVWQQGEVYLIQAAQAPALKTIPDSYYQLGALLEPLRVKDHYTIHKTEAPGKVFNSNEDYQHWLARFDKKPEK